jgi:hypothetical protein
MALMDEPGRVDVWQGASSCKYFCIFVLRYYDTPSSISQVNRVCRFPIDQFARIKDVMLSTKIAKVAHYLNFSGYTPPSPR